MKTIFYTVILASLVCCSPGNPPAEPFPPIPDLPGNTDDPDEPDDPDDGVTRVVLSADGKTDTKQLISSKGFNPIEAPDSYPTNHPGVEHISQVMDFDLGKWVFAFDIHIGPDKDRDQTQITDRQRNEIKSDKGSPSHLQGTLGEKHVYKWKFKLPQGMLATGSFTHIHQLKAVDGDDGIPLITLTVRKKPGGNEIQLIYNPPIEKGQSNNYLATASFSDFEDEWVEVTQSVTYGYDSDYSISIVRISDKKTLLSYSGKLDMWRTDTSIIRPKWGIYRSFGKNGSLKPEMRDERLLFADFEVAESQPE